MAYGGDSTKPGPVHYSDYDVMMSDDASSAFVCAFT